MTRTLLFTSGVPQNIWVEAPFTYVHIINLFPTPILDWDTPQYRLYGTPPSYSSLRVFGCSCYPHLGPYVSNKLSIRSVERVFLGYSSHHKGYRCLNPTTSRGLHTIYFLLYVDDIVLTSSNNQLLQTFIDTLGRGFDIKDLGPLHYFLGLQVTTHSQGLYINQIKYAHDLLSKHDLLFSKLVNTPMSAKFDLNATDGVALENPTSFLEIVGSLQYLTITRPDITFAVNTVSQFMRHPGVSHLVAVKLILSYVKHTLDHGLLFTPQRQPVTLSTYSNADWAGCPITRRSTSGYLVYLGSNLISWYYKKQPTIARSSVESEYHFLAHASAETT
ncbi:uncharacterized mitochondrial protein AtMg00810-like [Rosa chinensis]|uniref:uncharacterized mitochondrial protein AtMg00810-like n=1 Tax=Rosa chinensis TaxID=74649 RepID=UPI000D08C04F|nr:uncharacterized mitochondrial protein AtMg00810-like [Rosa chinensis]